MAHAVLSSSKTSTPPSGHPSGDSLTQIPPSSPLVNPTAGCIYAIIILGHPGAGKGTFAQSLKDKNITHLSIGDYLRSEYERRTDIGLRWKAEVESKGILSIDVVKEVTITLMEKISSSPPQVYFLDGHVRLLEQAKYMDELFNKYKNIHPIFIYIKADEQVCLERIPHRRTCAKCSTIYNLKFSPPKKEGACDHCDGSLIQRNTDIPQMGKNRIDTYAPYMYQTVEYYRGKNVLIEFDGNLPIQECMAKYREFYSQAIK
ncbi:MAG: nucleoside monophosphate kinase [Verrucomicrobia bacterium]|nr:nucleoside monophosphate kinase [Verrucomicrobiota bacterium]